MGSATHARGRRKKLLSGVRLSLTHPEADRSCRVCEVYAYKADGTCPTEETGELRKRPAGVPTPCRMCPKVPESDRAAGLPIVELRQRAEELSDANRQALTMHRRWKATGRFPDDELVAWYSGLVAEIEERYTRNQTRQTIDGLSFIGAVLGARYARPE